MSGMGLEDYDFTGLSDTDMFRLIAMAGEWARRFQRLEKAAKRAQEERVDYRQPVDVTIRGVHVARIERRHDGEGRWVVKDEDAYAQWLERNGFAHMTGMTLRPMPDAMDPGWIRTIIDHETDGEVPDGVEWRDGPSGGLAVVMDKANVDTLFDNRVGVRAVRLAIEGADADTGAKIPETETMDTTATPEPEPAPGGDDDLFAEYGL